MIFFIKNMVCDRCKTVVEAELQKLHLHPFSINLGAVEITEQHISPALYNAFERALLSHGFELIKDANHRLVEEIKTTVIALIQNQTDDDHIKYSEYLSGQLGVDYHILSRTFSKEEGLTIEQFVILQKIEKVKELLTYGELNLSEISWQMGYSSVAALSSQFKKVTGNTPSAFKNGAGERKGLDKIGTEDDNIA